MKTGWGRGGGGGGAVTVCNFHFRAIQNKRNVRYIPPPSLPFRYSPAPIVSDMAALSQQEQLFETRSKSSALSYPAAPAKPCHEACNCVLGIIYLKMLFFPNRGDRVILRVGIDTICFFFSAYYAFHYAVFLLKFC